MMAVKTKPDPKKKYDRAQRRQRIVMAVLAVVMAAALLLSTISMGLTPAAAVTQSEIDDLKNDASQLDDQKTALQAQLDAVQGNQDQLMEQKILLEEQLNVIDEKIANIDAQIAVYDQQIAETEADLAQAEADEAAQYELFCQRVRYMEEHGNVSYWAILFDAADFSDLLDRYAMVSEIMAYDEDVLDQLVALREQIEADKAALESARAGQQAARDEQAAAQAELQAQEAELDALMAEIEAQADELEGAMDALDAEAARLDKEIAELERQLAASGVEIVSESGYAWPLPGRTNLSSLCGGRKDPFTGKPATHSGIDIPAPSGTEIHAAKSGVVITSTYNSGGYGQYVVISHGSGNTTLYAHMVRGSQRVSVGDTVTQGQVIGEVGSTGRSTGPHLHYEVRVNNVRIDPVTLYSGLTYKGSPVS